MRRLWKALVGIGLLSLLMLQIGALSLLFLLLLPLHILSRWWKGENFYDIFTSLGD